MENDFKKKLKEYREKINNIDHDIVDLLNERAKLVIKIKKLKKSKDVPHYSNI